MTHAGSPAAAVVSGRGIDAWVEPEDTLDVLSQAEVARFCDAGQSGLHDTLRRCALAVLNTGSRQDSGKEVLERYRDFDVRVVPRLAGIALEIRNAPPNAFVDGEMIRGIKEHLFAVLRDVAFASGAALAAPAVEKGDGEALTQQVFQMLRNARVLDPRRRHGTVVCWGGHSISREEYEYSKEVGYELGLRGFDICTGCGPGAMKGPMKGATIAHAKQRLAGARYIGITEPGIIAAESPNALVNALVVMPDIEKRLESFVRLGHGIVVFPGGVGTAEEILYLLGLLLAPGNETQAFPLVFTGPSESASYFAAIDEFVGLTLGEQARGLYRVVIDDPRGVGRAMRAAIEDVAGRRRAVGESFCFNWGLRVPIDFQRPFQPTHAAVRGLALRTGAAPHLRAATLRRVCSAVVAGNVKEDGIRAIESRGPFELDGDPVLLGAVDALLRRFAAEGRMKLGGRSYQPCWRLADDTVTGAATGL